MARRKLPLFTERTLAETKATQIALAQKFVDRIEDVTCKIKCTYCCHHAVLVTLPEGVLLYKALAHRGLWTPSLQKKLRERADQTIDLSPVVWHLSNIPCPLLDKDLCLVYPARPFSCRTAVSQQDPANCHPHKVNIGATVPRRAVLEEFLTSQVRLLARHRMEALLMPIAVAVLFGERVMSGDTDFEHFGRFLWRNFYENAP